MNAIAVMDQTFPPRGLHNLEAEAALLGALMLDNRQIARVLDVIDPSDFFEPIHADIYAAILKQEATGKPANAVLIKPYFDGDERLNDFGGPVYIARLTLDDSGLLAAVPIAEQIADLSRRRAMQAALTGAAQACDDLDQTLPQIVAQADAAIVSKTNDTIHQPTGGQCIDELLDSFGQPKNGVRCGVIECLDTILGPMRPKQLIIGAARPGMGKTAFALSYALGAAKNGHGVLFVSLEMASVELAARMAADLCFRGDGTGIPFAAIRDGTLDEWGQRQVARAGSYLHGVPFTVIDAGRLTIGRLNMLVRRHARQMEARGHKLELVIVDYLQLLDPDQRARSAYEGVSEVSRGLKAIAKDHGVAVLALAQLSREVEKRPDKRPQLSDLRDSGQIEQDADAVLFLTRKEYYLRQSEPPEFAPGRAEWEASLDACKGQIEFILAKRRNGTTGTAIGEFHGAFQAVRG